VTSATFKHVQTRRADHVDGLVVGVSSESVSLRRHLVAKAGDEIVYTYTITTLATRR